MGGSSGGSSSGGGGPSPNSAPTANNDVALVQANPSNNPIDVLANDSDPDGDTLTIVSATAPKAGTTQSKAAVPELLVTPDGKLLRFTPPPGFIGVQPIVYTVSDGNGSAATGLITVVVSPIALSVPSIAVGDIATFNNSNTSATLNVLANDIDPSGTGLTVSAVDVIAGLPTGNITATTDGSTVTVTPPAGYVGVFTLSYTIIDGAGQTSVAPIVVTVAPIALPPVAVPDLAVLPQAAADVVLDVRANDLDNAGGGLTLSAARLSLALPPEAGLSVRVEGGNLVLSRPAGYFGIVTLGYTVTDGNGQSAPGVATVRITPAALSLPLPPPPPLAVPDVALVTQAASDIVLNVRSNDMDTSGSGLTLSAASLLLALPMDTGITVAITNNELRVTRPASYAGVITVN